MERDESLRPTRLRPHCRPGIQQVSLGNLVHAQNMGSKRLKPEPCSRRRCGPPGVVHRGAPGLRDQPVLLPHLSARRWTPPPRPPEKCGPRRRTSSSPPSLPRALVVVEINMPQTMEEQYGLLQRYEVRVPKEELGTVSDMTYSWKKVNKLAPDVGENLGRLQVGFKKELGSPPQKNGLGAARTGRAGGWGADGGARAGAVAAAARAHGQGRDLPDPPPPPPGGPPCRGGAPVHFARAPQGRGGEEEGAETAAGGSGWRCALGSLGLSHLASRQWSPSRPDPTRHARPPAAAGRSGRSRRRDPSPRVLRGAAGGREGGRGG